MSESKSEYFPRSKVLPPHSPNFWVEQKDRYLRQLLISDIEASTKRRLLVYFSNRFLPSQIDHRDVIYINELFSDVSKEPIDLLLETSGGLTDATESVISLIQQRCDDLRVIVANSAKSNGTLIALAAKSILMGCCSELGPIEPHLQGIPTTILKNPDPSINVILRQQAEYAFNQTKKLATTLLSKGMLQGKDKTKIDELVEKLSSRGHYYSHGSVINHREAAELELKVEYLDESNELWRQLWLLYCMYDHDARKASLLKIFETRRINRSIFYQPTVQNP